MKITAGEIIGELKKARRIYEVFDEAEKIVRFLSEREAYERTLEKDIAEAIERLKSAEDALELKVLQSAQVQNDLEDRMKKVEETVNRKQGELNEYVAKAKEEAKTLVETAQGQIVSLQVKIQDLQEVERVANTAAREAVAQKDKIEVELAAVKAKFLKSFN